MPKTLTIEAYEFHELDATAKAKARDWFRECTAGDFDAEATIDDAVEMARIMGITIGRRQDGRVDLSWAIDPTWAAFSGEYAGVSEAEAAIVAVAPPAASVGNAELSRIAHGLDALQRKYHGRLRADIYGRDERIDVSSEIADADEDPSDKGPTRIAVADADEDVLYEILRDFCRWIARQIEAEYEYQMSDEAVDENITANDYWFTKDGQRSAVLA